MNLFPPPKELTPEPPRGSWRIEVPLAPKGAGRHRTAVVVGHVHTYQDYSTKQWKAGVAYFAAGVLPKEPLEGPIQVNIWAILPRPERLLKRSKKTGALLHGDEGLMWAPTKPDTDNIEKGVYDALKSAWRDDKQVVCGVTRKLYAEAAGKPRLVILIVAPPVMSMGLLYAQEGA